MIINLYFLLHTTLQTKGEEVSEALPPVDSLSLLAY
jgi:hypothetical protein